MVDRKTIGIDVDITIVDPIEQKGGWFEWLNSISGNYYESFDEFFWKNCDRQGLLNYNLSSYFKGVDDSEGFAFWQRNNLYQNFTPHEEAVKVINELSKDYNILFISMCQSGHFKSKVQFLKDNFNIPKERFGFNATHEKHFSKVDLIIDDRNKFLNQITDLKVPKIKFESIYTQDEELKVSVDLKTDNWYAIHDYIKEYF